MLPDTLHAVLASASAALSVQGAETTVSESGSGLMLMASIVLPLVFAGLVALLPAKNAKLVSLLGMGVSGLLVAFLALVFDWGNAEAFQLGNSADPLPWLSKLGLSISVGVDSVSMLLMLLTALLGPICVVASFTAINERVKTYYGWLLILQAAMLGVFAARDLVLFYICFEFTLVPMFILISLYGSTNRKKAAARFFLYTFTGSIIALAGLLYVVYFNSRLDVSALPALDRGLFPKLGTWTFDIATLERAGAMMSLTEQAWVLLALFAGFAVKVPLFPVHTWLPLAHTEAPTAGSVILAGVLLKLGTYGLYRFALALCPGAMVEYAPVIAVLCVIGILYGGLICWVQQDVKKLVAYSSVAHLGFCVLGLAALNHIGITGSILYMINHGLSTGALFLLIGMMYERYHTRSLKEVGGLAARMPIWATFMVFFTMASVGLPGLNGFVSEFMCLMGAFQASSAWGSGLWGSAGSSTIGATTGDLGPWFALIAGVGMIIAAMYLLYMLGKVVFGPLVEPKGHGAHAHGGHGDAHGEKGDQAHGEHGHTLPPDLTSREILVLVPLAALCIFLGVYPKPAIDALDRPVQMTVERLSQAREALERGGASAEAAALEAGEIRDGLQATIADIRHDADEGAAR